MGWIFLWNEFAKENLHISYSKISLHDQMEKISDSRIRVSKLIGRSVLGSISMWLAFPSTDKVLPGGNWYDQVWDKNDLAGYKHVDEMIALSPCNNYDKIFLQVGAHLGAFPLVATYRKCFGAALNNWSEKEFMIINAAGASQNGGYTWFNPKGISMSKINNITEGKVRVPLVSVDALNDQYGFSRGQKESRIAFVIIDVEWYEQEVLLGSRKLIENKSVLVFEIEVWTTTSEKGLITSFPGLELFLQNGYRLYTTAQNAEMNFTSCDEVTTRLIDLPRIFNQSCQQAKLPADQCLGEVFAIRSDIPPLRQWFSACPK
jgi:Methyltransferase FkbM domain